MILTKAQIESIIKDNPNKGLITKGIEYNKKMRLHLYGEGMKEKTDLIKDYEKPSLHALRVKYARSNKDLFSRLGRPIDKVFSARGGSIYYNLPDTQDKIARSLAADVRNGFSIRKWVEMFWKAHLLDDPYGMIFLEILPMQQAVLNKQQGKSFVYPTYKSITSVYDYLPKGTSVEYVVFHVDATEKKKHGLKVEDQIYRVVDDAFDYYVKRNGDEVEILQELTFPNYFTQVPAQINSDIINPQSEDCFISFYDDVIELADHFLLKGGIKLTHEFLHAYPKYWQYAPDCGNCQGTGFVSSEKCPSCKGVGKQIISNVSDNLLLEFPAQGDTTVTPDVGGYISPDKVYYEISTGDLRLLEELMNVTLWGASSKVKTQGLGVDQGAAPETATGEMLDIKPESDRLQIISEMAEKKHKFILDNVVRLQVSQGYQGSSVNYGRRYMIEPPDAIWAKYSKARAAGAAISALDDLLLEYYESKFASDPVKLAIQVKLMKVEPFVHYKISEVQSFKTDENDYKAKLYFGEWLSLQNEGIILSGDVTALRDSLNVFVSGKVLPQPEQKLIAA